MIPPGSTLGLLGGGQLGRMFTHAATSMGYKVTVVDPDPDGPAAQVATACIPLQWDDPTAETSLLSQVAAVTTEFENVPAEVLERLAVRLPVRPGAAAVAVAQDRVLEKTFLNNAGIPTASWFPMASVDGVAAPWDSLECDEAIIKTARLGYDGKGQSIVGSPSELVGAFESMGGVPCIVEERVGLACEVSVLVARGADGTTATWALAENVHVNGILHTTIVPARVSESVASTATALAISVAQSLEYVGVLCVECFVTESEQVLVNEIAPRPHNSGHWTIDAAVTSQFEQQVRTLAGLPLGDTSQVAPVAMVNILGDLWENGDPDWAAALSIPGCRLHLYGKREARPGRKMGHLTVTAIDESRALQSALTAWESLNVVSSV